MHFFYREKKHSTSSLTGKFSTIFHFSKGFKVKKSRRKNKINRDFLFFIIIFKYLQRDVLD